MNRFLWVCSNKECSAMKYNELEAKDHKHFMIKCILPRKRKNTKILKNIFRCRVCGRYGMAEEADLHECRALKEYVFVKDTIRVFDGKSWYPLNLKKVQRNTATNRNE